MIITTEWGCHLYLIDQALKEHPVTEEVVTLNTPQGEFFYDPWTIKNEYKGSAWEQVLNTLPIPIGEARIITLVPGESYMAHADIDNRWHLNLTGERSYLVDLDQDRMWPCERDGRWRYMFTSKMHSASNYGSIPRRQLVVRELLKRSTRKNTIKVSIEPAYEQHDYRYKFDNLVSPWLNKKNQDCELDNFSHNGRTATFNMSASLKDELTRLITSDFRVYYD
jgi:hypothetical protein